MTSPSRPELAASLLLQSPPGQVSQVYQHLRTLILSEGVSNQNAADADLQQAAEGVLEQYNVEQLVTIRLPGEEKDTIICRAAQLPGGRFADHAAKKSFKFDHLRNAASDPQPLKVQEASETIRAALDSALATYIPDRYTDGVSSVFVVLTPSPSDAQALESPEASLTAAIEEKVRLVSDNDTGASTGASGTLGEDERAGGEEAAEEAAEESAEPVTSSETEAPLQGEADATDSVMSNAGEDTIEGDGGDKAEEDQANAALAAVSENAEGQDAEDDPVEAAEAAAAVEEQTDVLAAQEDEPEPRGDPKYVVHIVGNRYNLSNYWSGRWRSSYTYDPASPATLSATAQIQVHYFESGNVQLSGSRSAQIELPGLASADSSPSSDPTALARALVRAIERHEDEYEGKVNEALTDLNERAFKALRRQLPVTRQKIDWDKVLNYKIGTEMSK